MNDVEIKTIEKTWDTIAESFDITRRKPWKQCIDFIQKLSSTSVVADLGCGNGRHLIPYAQQCKHAIGVDISRKLLNITKNKTMKQKLSNVLLIHADLVHIPLQNNSLDAAIFVASLHTIKGREQRVQALKELRRVLKNNGTALISVWSRWQDRYRKHFLKTWFTQKGYNEFGDIDLYWKQHNLNIPRFYHFYSKRELINDIKQSGLKIKEVKGAKLHSKLSPDNYFAIVRNKNTSD